MIFTGFYSLFSSPTPLQHPISMPAFSLGLLPRSRGFCRLIPSRHYSPHHILLAIKLLKKTLFEYNSKKVTFQFDPFKSTFSPNQTQPFLKALSKYLPIINDGKTKFQPSAQPRLLVNVVSLAWLLGESHCQHYTVTTHKLNSAQQFREMGKARNREGRGAACFFYGFQYCPQKLNAN